MLWVDRDWIWVSDLASVEPEIEEDAAALDTTLAGHNGLIRRAMEEMTRVLENALVSFTTYISSNDMSANHLAAVMFTGSAPNQRRRFTTDQIVIAGRNQNYWSEIKQWGVTYTLRRFYMTAANRAKEDRYSIKRDYYYNEEVNHLRPSLYQSGVPIVYRPMPAPDATNLRNPGTWAVSAVSGASSSTLQYDVAISYTDSTRFISVGSRMNTNGEGGPSQVKSVTLGGSQVIQVDLTGLNAPAGNVSLTDIARGFVVPLNADGYNLWVGLHGQTLYLQNLNGPINLRQNLVYALAGDPAVTAFSAVNPAQYPLADDTTVQASPYGNGQYVEAFMTINPNLRIRM